jgi:hypothetical protein
MKKNLSGAGEVYIELPAFRKLANEKVKVQALYKSNELQTYAWNLLTWSDKTYNSYFRKRQM